MSSAMIETMRTRAVGDLRQAADAIEQAQTVDDIESIRTACAQARLGGKTANELASLFRREARSAERRAKRAAEKANAG